MKPAGSKGGKPSKLRSPRSGQAVSLERRAAGIIEEMHALGRSIARSEGIQSRNDLPVDEVTVQVTLKLGKLGSEGAQRNEAKRFVRMIRSRIGEAIRGLGTYRHGRVFCFKCDQPDCPHSEPGSPDETFIGYNSSGKPQWQSLANLCIERRDPRAELLYATPPEVIAVVMEASELTGDLLPGFGKGDKAYNVLGQVVLGLVPPDLVFPGPAEPRTAITFQLVETRSVGAGRRLRLNLLGMSIDAISQAAVRARNGGPAESIRRTVQVTRDRLVQMGRKAATEERRGYEPGLEKAVVPLLNRLRSDLERTYRSRKRKTSHAKERHADGDRPTSQAVSDARKAPDERLLHDKQKDTIVVLGPRGRTHVFSLDGRHVTSMVLKAGEPERRFVKSRWVPADPSVLKPFRESLK